MPASSAATCSARLVDRLAHGLGHLAVAAGVHHHVADPAHQILAEADLRVHQPGRGDDLAAGEIAEMAGDGGRADVDREAVDAIAKARPDRDDPVAEWTATVTFQAPWRSACCSPWSIRRSQVELVQLPLLAQRLLQALEVAGRTLHVGLVDLDIVQADHRIELDRPDLGTLAHDLLVDLALGRDVDHDVALAASPGS